MPAVMSSSPKIWTASRRIRRAGCPAGHGGRLALLLHYHAFSSGVAAPGNSAP